MHGISLGSLFNGRYVCICRHHAFSKTCCLHANHARVFGLSQRIGIPKRDRRNNFGYCTLHPIIEEYCNCRDHRYVSRISACSFLYAYRRKSICRDSQVAIILANTAAIWSNVLGLFLPSILIKQGIYRSYCWCWLVNTALSFASSFSLINRFVHRRKNPKPGQRIPPRLKRLCWASLSYNHFAKVC